MACFRLVQLHNRETLIQKTKTHSRTRRWIGLSIRCEKSHSRLLCLHSRPSFSFLDLETTQNSFHPNCIDFGLRISNQEYPSRMSFSSIRDSFTSFHQMSTEVHGYSENLTIAAGFEPSVEAERCCVGPIRHSFLLILVPQDTLIH